MFLTVKQKKFKRSIAKPQFLIFKVYYCFVISFLILTSSCIILKTARSSGPTNEITVELFNNNLIENPTV